MATANRRNKLTDLEAVLPPTLVDYLKLPEVKFIEHGPDPLWSGSSTPFSSESES